jgi:WD40 repeat protein
MQWMKPQGRYLKMATTNSRSIKLWKMFERSDKKVVKSAGKELVMPKLQILDTNFVAEVQAPFPSKHVGSINSLSVSSNEEYMISSDDSQVFLWSVEKPLQPFILANFLTK